MSENTSQYRRFEIFLNSLLKEDLKSAYEAREKFKQQLIEFDELKHTIELVKDQNAKDSGFQSALNIGCDFYVDANVKDVSKILLNIGANVFIECTLEEALTFIAKKQKLLEHQIEYMSCKISQIDSYITLYMSSLTLDSTSSNPSVDTSVLEDVYLDIGCGIVEPKVTASEAVQNLLLKTLKSSS